MTILENLKHRLENTQVNSALFMTKVFLALILLFVTLVAFNTVEKFFSRPITIIEPPAPIAVQTAPAGQQTPITLTCPAACEVKGAASASK